MIKLKNIHLENFKGFYNFDIEFEDNMTCIAGINGSGKSSLLKASSEAISWIIEQIMPRKNKPILISNDDISIGKDSSKMIASIQGENFTNLEIVIESKNITKRVRQQKTEVKQNIEAQRYFSSLREEAIESDDKSLPVLIYYPCNRSDLAMKMRLSKQREDLSDKYKVYDNALESVAKFDDFFIWFRDREDRENAEKITLFDKGDSTNIYSDSYLDAVRNAILAFAPGFDTIRISKERNRMLAKKGGEEIDVSNLSDGEKSIIVMFGDIARRLAMANPGNRNPLDGDGIILIDEIELHLHPSWQRKIINVLSSTFPHCQFIITTHSPQVLGEVNSKNIRLLSNFKVSTPRQSYGLDTNSVLATLMSDGKQVLTKNAKVDKQINEISKLIDEEKFDIAKKKLSDLEEKLNGNTPDTIRLSSLLTMLSGGK